MKSNTVIDVCRLTRTTTDTELTNNREEKRFNFGATLKRCGTHLAKQMSDTVVFVDTS